MLKGYDVVIKRGKNKKKYLNCVCAFDIETTNITEIEQNIMYIWQMQIDEITIIGRTWIEWFELLDNIKDYLERKHLYLCIFIHNASYEFQYVKGQYDFQSDEVFATESRKILYFTMFDCFEFRCSYMLTNMSLLQFTKRYGVDNIKLDGDKFNYNKTRYAWTELTSEELAYCINDVKGLVQAVKKLLVSEEKNIATIPLTSTGLTRADVKRAMRKFNKQSLLDMQPTLDVYLLEREAFRGGNVHGSRLYAGKILSNMYSQDMSSAYIGALVNGLYPMSKFIHEGAITIKRLENLIYKYNKPVLMRVSFENVRLKNDLYGCPYLTRDKCRNIKGGHYFNGRILSADYLETTITDIDFKIILNYYKFDSINPYDVYSSTYGRLPKPLIDVIIDYFKKKTELKNVPNMEVYYNKAKARLNSCYGCMATDPVKRTVEFINGEFRLKDEDVNELLETSNKKAFLNYAWGVWCTAITRSYLQFAIDKADENYSFVYCDTDSVKSLEPLDLSEFNDYIRKESYSNGAYADDPNGERHYCGVYEDENYSIPNRFCTLGAKKYVLEDSDGKLHVTIAGVNKKYGGDELGQLENFKEGFTFYKAGGTESKYNDNVDMVIFREGQPIHITDNIYIKDSTYTLGLTAEYKQILEGYIDIKYSDHTINGLYDASKYTITSNE